MAVGADGTRGVCIVLAADHFGVGAGGKVAVARAIAELRAGRPVRLFATAEADRAVLVIGAEAFDGRLAEAFAAVGRGLRLVLPGPRLDKLGRPSVEPGCIALAAPAAPQAALLALDVEAALPPTVPVTPATGRERAALDLLGLALVLPAAVVADVAADAAPGLLTATTADIAAYRKARVETLHVVGRARVPLEGAPQTEFVVFRGGEGLRDQVAIIVGRPDLSGPVPVRLHSACLTGDLFGSLKCDCGDQLRDTARLMAEGAGGILLYLDQEGRGNGIANKMRAYHLQSEGYDTFDADAALGFGLDQRRFDFAAEMLRRLGVRTVRLLTNNPQKIAALAAAGLEVAGDERVLGRPTAENAGYLAAKRDRAGHLIDLAALAARADD
ncbi:GTP cyclohydrolase II RibA [Xanthobacter agilis]|uniref:GTP cyclohydrolase-2 n=1 Tax=Xanthobacter agilis TaxID=47492 RepID=A0ABU0L8L3_XANAG|nr:GTP cyclohydrolase II RibA [Xanthobacter agilis]MDQ0503449.1 GTP cyclohydrolase II [Xanthobacter agilis]